MIIKPKYYAVLVLILSTGLSIFFMDEIGAKNKTIIQLVKSMDKYGIIISRQFKDIARLENELNRTQTVKVSFYHPASKGINSDSDHTNTATMTKPIAGYTVAISDELFYDGWLGSKVYIDGFGVFHAKDRMDKSIAGKQIDICVGTRKLAMTLGIRNGVVAVKL